MQKATVNLLFIVAFAVSGCTASALPTQPIVESQATAFSTLTPSPLPTATEPFATTTLTPEPGLKTNGPYFAYFREVNGISQFVMMDADGGGRKAISLPQGITDSLPDKNFGFDMKFISPDGKWLAFYTGSAGDSGFGSDIGNGPFDLTLNLLDLDTGGTQIIAPLLSNDYPNNFVEAAKKINASNITSADLQYAFLVGITRAISWSPTGRYLAFAGQMDGLSSDLYVYDMEGMTIRRLTSGDEELQWIDWSSDEKWILHGSVSVYGAGMQYSIYAVAADESSIRQFGYGLGTDWLNSHQFLEYENQNVFGDYDLRLVDLNTGKISEIWDGSFHDYAVSPNGDWLILFAFTSAIPPAEEKPNFIPGLQLINLKSLKIIQNPSPLLDPPDTFLRTEDGEIVALPAIAKQNGEIIFASPDTKYWAVANNQDIRIYSSDITLIRNVPIPSQDTKLTDVQWSPNSSGLFLIYGANIYSVNVPSGDINLIETNLLDNYGLTYKWVGGQ